MKTLTRILPLAACGLALVAPGRADDKKAAPAFAVEAVKDVTYYDGKNADADKHKLDLYLPKGHKEFPTVVYVHGGGWTRGSRTSIEKQAEVFVKHGVAVASVGYRLSPAVKHPEHVKDVARAFAWVKRNIAKHGGKPDLLFVSGHSAGGHLAALLAADESYLKAEKLSLADVKGAIPISGVFTITKGRINAAFPEDEDGCRQASPLTHVKDKHPPFLILYAEKEDARFGKMADEFGAALTKNKCDATVVQVKDRDHGSIVGKMTEDGDPAAKAVLEFVIKHTNR